MEVLIFILVLVALIVVHELGHFIVAKLCGMRVEEFGIGYPPRALTLGRAGETEYTLNWLPFGGFVRIYGEDAVAEHADPRAFGARPVWAQVLVLIAGIAMNLVFAWGIFTYLYMQPHWVSDTVLAEPAPLFTAIAKGAETTALATSEVASDLGHFFLGIFTLSADFSQVAGPVGIAGAVGSAAAHGATDLLTLVALISINLALINLIPVPALDGGRLLFVLLEALLRRRMRPALAARVNAAGFALLLLLMAAVTAHDIYKLAG